MHSWHFSKIFPFHGVAKPGACSSVTNTNETPDKSKRLEGSIRTRANKGIVVRRHTKTPSTTLVQGLLGSKGAQPETPASSYDEEGHIDQEEISLT